MKSSLLFPLLSLNSLHEQTSSFVFRLMMSDEGKPRSRIRQMGGGTTSTLNPNEFFSNFQRLNVMYAFMDTLVRLYPNLVSVKSIGKSFEGRDMKMLKITGRNVHQGRQGSNSSKPIFFMDAGIHAREWAAPPTALFLAYSLASQYEMNDRIRRVVDDFEWHILPVANPDGYEYTHTNDRFWRKTRSRSRGNDRQSSSCTGTDPNRNFGFHWRENGASSNPCADTFAGTKAFSEPETMNIANHIWNNRNNMLVYIALHSYSQLWLTPWGFTRELPPDYDDLYTKARRAADAVEKVYGTRFRVGSSTRILYAAAGGSDDWAKGAAGVPYAYTVELRPSSNAMRGFVLSPSEIRPCGQEMLAGFVQLATDVSDTRGIEVRSRSAKKRFRKLR